AFVCDRKLQTSPIDPAREPRTACLRLRNRKRLDGCLVLAPILEVDSPPIRRHDSSKSTTGYEFSQQVQALPLVSDSHYDPGSRIQRVPPPIWCVKLKSPKNVGYEAEQSSAERNSRRKLAKGTDDSFQVFRWYIVRAKVAEP